jgi:hypothetical protein
VICQMMKRRTRRDFRLLAYAPKLGSYCCTGQTDVKIQESSVPQSHVQAITVLCNYLIGETWQQEDKHGNHRERTAR